MKFLSLTVENYGVFRGTHHLDFSPPQGQGKGFRSDRRNVVLVRGHNGAGKSTLFSAFGLVLHGSLAIDDRISRADYNDFCLARMHRDGNGTRVGRTRLALAFEFVESGRVQRFDVERQWTRNGRVVTEDLVVRRDGVIPDDIAPSDYNGYLTDLFPTGLSPVCFFDAEKLDALSSSAGHEAQLAGIMRRLLGLDLVERLREDLDFYTLKQGGKEIEPLRVVVFEHQQELADSRAACLELQRQVESLETRATEVRQAMAEQEQRLAAAGGTYAERRPQLIERRASIEREVEAHHKELREMCEGLLPFTLAPALCRILDERLLQEAQAAQNAAIGVLWKGRIAELREQMKDDVFWRGLDVPEKMYRKIANRVVEKLTTSNEEARSEKPLHPLSEPERAKLQSWINQVANDIPAQVRALSATLRTLKAEAKKIDAELHRAPDDAVLTPIHAEIERLNSELAEVLRECAEKNTTLASLNFSCEEKQRTYNRAVEEFSAAQKNRQKLALANRSKSVLRVYKDALTRQQLGALEKSVVENFNRLCQKERLLRGITIDPETFTVCAHDVQGHTLGLEDFSAGERQLYSLSLLWALRQSSGRELPLLIDTPLGRLDAAHRDRLLDTYFPDVAKQVLLFTTTAEVDEALLPKLERRLVHHYSLRFDAASEQSDIKPVPVSRSVLNGLANGFHNGHQSANVIPLVAVQGGLQ